MHDPEELGFLAEEIRNEFIRKKREVTNKNFRLGERWDKQKFWLAAAELCADKKVDPRSFMEAIFAHTQNAIGLLPNMLGGRMVQEALEYHFFYDIKDILRIEKKHNINMLKRISNSPEETLGYLRDSLIPMLPYLRVFLSSFDPQVMKEFGEEAYEYIQVRPGHIEALADLGFDYEEFKSQMTKLRNGTR